MVKGRTISITRDVDRYWLCLRAILLALPSSNSEDDKIQLSIVSDPCQYLAELFVLLYRMSMDIYIGTGNRHPPQNQIPEQRPKLNVTAARFQGNRVFMTITGRLHWADPQNIPI